MAGFDALLVSTLTVALAEIGDKTQLLALVLAARWQKPWPIVAGIAAVEEALAFPHQQSTEAFQAQVDVCLAHDTADRLSRIAAPTLVLAGELDIIFPPRHGRIVAEGIRNARFEVMPGEAHQPFQEVPDEFNARVDAFWREVDAVCAGWRSAERWLRTHGRELI